MNRKGTNKSSKTPITWWEGTSETPITWWKWKELVIALTPWSTSITNIIETSAGKIEKALTNYSLWNIWGSIFGLNRIIDDIAWIIENKDTSTEQKRDIILWIRRHLNEWVSSMEFSEWYNAVMHFMNLLENSWQGISFMQSLEITDIFDYSNPYFLLWMIFYESDSIRRMTIKWKNIILEKICEYIHMDEQVISNLLHNIRKLNMSSEDINKLLKYISLELLDFSISKEIKYINIDYWKLTEITWIDRSWYKLSLDELSKIVQDNILDYQIIENNIFIGLEYPTEIILNSIKDADPEIYLECIRKIINLIIRRNNKEWKHKFDLSKEFKYVKIAESIQFAEFINRITKWDSSIRSKKQVVGFLKKLTTNLEQNPEWLMSMIESANKTKNPKKENKNVSVNVDWPTYKTGFDLSNI